MKLSVGLGLIFSTFLWANPLHKEHAEAEKNFHPNYASQATGDLKKESKRINSERYPWPVKVLSIGHTIASYQNYSFGGPPSPYFHHGLDIRADAGTDVLASTGGQVINIENYVPGNKFYWEVAIKDKEGFIWQYHHIEKNSIPAKIHEAFKNQTEIEAGTKLGEVIAWNVETFGERFDHIHLNILGKGRAYLNPFEFLELLPDKSSPEISNFKVIQGAIAKDNSANQGTQYTIAAEIKDLVLSDVFVVPPNEIHMAIDEGTPFRVWKFDSLPGGASNEDYVTDFFQTQLACGNYECRKPVINLGFNKAKQKVFPSTPGRHNLELIVSDYNGNETRKKFEWFVN